ncbi:uncharacterized protein LOC133971285 isoform X1 [Platichthys flesus]|uniref:uncharacterized protein LOC133971285 isoform X1 n=2 Tax=Platichthys flesus TaxID=8260 RepID=UPI002DBF3845|nr:uncharacterized protein LOC133971285 isoform X1 [Platichthys flesus]
MALGCFLWISGICFLLFNGNVGLPAMKGYGYPYNTDSKNMGDYVEDEALMSYDWQPSDGQPSAAAYTSYNKPAALWEPISVATQQTVPSAPAVESFVNSESRDWSLENPNSPLMFPLSHNYKPSNPAGPQPGPNTDSSTQGGGSQYVPHLVYEEVWQYPSENAAQSPSDGVSNTAGGAGQAGYTSTGSSTEYSSEPSYQMYPSNAGAQQVASSATGSSAPAQMSYQPQPVASPKEEVPVGVSEPILRPPPPPSYIIKYKDGFVRVRHLLNKSRYSPGLASGPAVRPAPSRRQAAAPVAVKNPQRTRIHG